MKKYYNLVQKDDVATIYIYGDIVSWAWLESDVTSYTLSRELEEIEATEVNVYINSYGGEVAEGLAIYNALKRKNAVINTYCDGFACSIASVIYMAGDNRYMYDGTLLMIHNPWTSVRGNAKELRKSASDLEVIAKSAFKAYKNAINITDEELEELLNNETFITAESAFEMGFATAVVDMPVSENVSQSARSLVMQRMQVVDVSEIKVGLDVSQVLEGVMLLNGKLDEISRKLEPKQKTFFNFKEENNG